MPAPILRLRFLAFLPLALTALLQPLQAAEMNTLKPAIMVNDQVISALEVEMRLKLALVSSGLEDSPEAREFLYDQVEQALIDEELQTQEADRLGITVSAEDEEKTLEQIAQGNGMNWETLSSRLEKAGILPAYLVDQVHAQLLWRALLRKEVLPRVIVTDEDINEAVARIQARQGEPQRLLAEIYLPIDNPSETAEVQQTADRVIEQIKRGGSFPALARQLSQAPTASVGGDMGWVDPGSLPQEIEDALAKINPHELTPPIVTPTGIYIMLLRDERPTPERLLTASVKMMTFPVRNFENRSAVNQAAGRASQAQKALSDCEAFEGVAKHFDATVEALPDPLEVSRMPQNLRTVTTGLPIGSASDLFRAPNGIGLAIVCAREDSGVDRAAVRERLLTEQVDRRARRYLQDLRRIATVEMRN